MVPCHKIQNQMIKEKFEDNGKAPPKFDVNDFRVYNPEDVQKYMEKHGLNSQDPEKMVEEYKKREQKYMEEKGVFELLKRCSAEFGKIGFISDNSIEGKKWFRKQLSQHKVPYQGLVVSEELGVEKPDSRLFDEFLDRRDEMSPDRFVYIGNNPKRDRASQKVGIDFVWTKQYNTFGGDYKGVIIEELNLESIREAIEKLEAKKK